MTLDLAGNKLGIRGANLVSAMLKKNITLQVWATLLCLQHRHCYRISHSNCTPQTLNLAQTGLGPSGVKELCLGGLLENDTIVVGAAVFGLFGSDRI